MNTIATAAREYANRPADERFPSIEALIAARQHEQDYSSERTVNVRDLRAVADGENVKLAGPSGKLARFTHWSFGQLARVIGAPAAYLRQLPAALAADCVNQGIQDRTVPGTDVNLLLRAANGSPEPIARSVTSDSYARVWDAPLYTAIADNLPDFGLPPTWSGEAAGAYAGDRDSFLITCSGGSIVTDPSLRSDNGGNNGAMFRGLLIRNSEVGAAALTIEQVLYRFVCGNHMLWGAVIDQRFKRRHVGHGDSLTRDTIREIMAIAAKWRDASPAKDEALIRTMITHNLATTDDAIVAELRKLGATAEQAAAILKTTREAESQVAPGSYWGLANGATRLSQESIHQSERYELDRVAGLILARGARVAA